MKKIFILLSTLALMSGCAMETKTESVTYIAPGRYYTSGEVITQDGNIWGYTQNIISESESYDNEPVLVLFDDKGTPDNIYDDEILGVVLDRETQIYDKLEAELSQDFIVERDGNYLTIK